MGPTVRLLALLVALAVPSSASAATVQMLSIPGNGHDMEPPSSRVSIAAPSGERNVVTVDLEPAGTWLVRDAGAPLRAGTGCAVIDANTARCTNPHPRVVDPGVEVDSGDGDDIVTIAQPIHASVRAGSGDDSVSAAGTLDGGLGDDTLLGGAEPDTLMGGPGRDVLRAGAGNDRLSGDGETSVRRRPRDGAGYSELVEDDLIDGGEGRDIVEYGSRTTRLVIDLADGLPDGERGERDHLIAIEDVMAGSGDDILRGNAAANTLYGYGGRDRLDGRAGSDTLEDGEGVDVLRGGPGNDQLYAHDAGDRMSGDGGNDKLAGFAGRVHLHGGSGDDELAPVSTPASLSCGSGRDLISPSGFGSRRPLARMQIDGCERAITAGAIIDTVPRRGLRGGLALPIECRKPYPFPTDNCRGAVTLRLLRSGRAPLTLGRGPYDVVAGTLGAAPIAVPAARRRALAAERRPRVEVTVTVVHHDRFAPTYVSYTGRWRVRLGP